MNALFACLIFALLALFLLWHFVAMPRLNKLPGTDWGTPGINRLDKINRLFCRYVHGLNDAKIPMPGSGGVVLVANHLSGLDPLLLIAAAPRPLRFLIAREQYERWWLKWFLARIGCIPVDRTGRADKAFYEAKKALAAGEVVAVFPEGGISSPTKPVTRLKRGARVLADLAEVPILPVRVESLRGVGLTLAALFVPAGAHLIIGQLLPHASNTKNTQRMQQLSDFIRPDLAQN